MQRPRVACRRVERPLDEVSARRTSSQGVAARSKRERERETGFEPATFCLGSPDLVSVVA
jgi:hypothetical protein